MNYAAILAGGVGTRVNSIDYPKQFYTIDGKPVIIYTTEKLVNSSLIDLVYIAVIEDYYDYMMALLEKYNLTEKTVLITGGKTRMDTIDKVVEAILQKNITDDDVILIHDAVRPFITNKIIEDSIEGAKKYGATVATIPATDTIVSSVDDNVVSFIPNRRELYCGQSPDTFNLKRFIEMEGNLTEEQKNLVTGTSQVCTLNGQEILMIPGDPINFKITTDFDLLIAENIIAGGYNEKDDNNSVKRKSFKLKGHK